MSLVLLQTFQMAFWIHENEKQKSYQSISLCDPRTSQKPPPLVSSLIPSSHPNDYAIPPLFIHFKSLSTWHLLTVLLLTEEVSRLTWDSPLCVVITINE